ncbi:MAG: hypothetical protein KDC98_00935 [Planctomycetes bacterium]|nr:hypothetical protein [Planctomycetota bacterium]
MKFANQRLLPYPNRPAALIAKPSSLRQRDGDLRSDHHLTSIRITSFGIVPAAQPLRRNPPRSLAVTRLVSVPTARQPSTAVGAPALSPNQAEGVGGRSFESKRAFASKRFRHAAELATSCMFIALFVVLVLFG